MPVMMSSFLLPLSPSLPFLVEDIYVKGAMRCVATIAARDAIHGFARKEGMLCYVSETGLHYKLLADKTTWEEFKPGGDEVDIANLLAAVSPVILSEVSGKQVISLLQSQIIPEAPGPGYQLYSGANGNLLWVDMSGSQNKGTRATVTYSAMAPIQAGASEVFTLPAPATLMLISVILNTANVKLELFSSDARDDLNPYTFVSAADMLQDQGITVTEDGNEYHRRYSFLASATGAKMIYGRLTNVGSAAVQPTVNITYLVME